MVRAFAPTPHLLALASDTVFCVQLLGGKTPFIAQLIRLPT